MNTKDAIENEAGNFLVQAQYCQTQEILGKRLQDGGFTIKSTKRLIEQGPASQQIFLWFHFKPNPETLSKQGQAKLENSILE